jgi:threonine/homoserine/homoserine lactone efflux protein
MNPTQAFVGFTLVSAVLTVTPGLDTALVIRTATVEGSRRALAAGLGICSGILFWGLIAATGLGALFATSTFFYDTVRIIGAIYLVGLGCRFLLSRGSDSTPRWSSHAFWPHESAYLRGLLTNLLNPKVGIFYVTLLPQFVPSSVPVTRFSMLLAFTHALESFLWFVALSRATQLLAHWLARGGVQAAINRITGVAFIGLGLRLMVARQ